MNRPTMVALDNNNGWECHAVVSEDSWLFALNPGEGFRMFSHA